MTSPRRSAEGGQQNCSALAAPPAPRPQAERGARRERGVLTASTHTHTLPRHTQVGTSTPDNYATQTREKCTNMLAHTRVDHTTRSLDIRRLVHPHQRQFCTHIHACTYS